MFLLCKAEIPGSQHCCHGCKGVRGKWEIPFPQWEILVGIGLYSSKVPENARQLSFNRQKSNFPHSGDLSRENLVLPLNSYHKVLLSNVMAPEE